MQEVNIKGWHTCLYCHYVHSFFFISRGKKPFSLHYPYICYCSFLLFFILFFSQNFSLIMPIDSMLECNNAWNINHSKLTKSTINFLTDNLGQNIWNNCQKLLFVYFAPPPPSFKVVCESFS